MIRPSSFGETRGTTPVTTTTHQPEKGVDSTIERGKETPGTDNSNLSSNNTPTTYFQVANLDASSLISRYQSDIENIVKELHGMNRNDVLDIISRNQESKSGNLKYRVNFSSGKHQSVFGIEIDFPEGISKKIVARGIKSDFYNNYRNSNALQKFFPKVFSEITFTDPRKNHKDHKCKFLLIERIEGRVERQDDFTSDDFINTEQFEQLLDDFYDQLKSSIHDGFILGDVQPLEGHNIAFNSNTGKFQIFDPDVFEDGKSVTKAQRIIATLERAFTNIITASDQTKLFWFQITKRLARDFSDVSFSYNSQGQYDYKAINTDDELAWHQANGSKVIYYDRKMDNEHGLAMCKLENDTNLGSDISPEEYAQRKNAINRQYEGTYISARNQTVFNAEVYEQPLVYGPWLLNTQVQLRQDLLEACRANDFELFKSLTSENKNIFETSCDLKRLAS